MADNQNNPQLSAELTVAADNVAEICEDTTNTLFEARNNI